MSAIEKLITENLPIWSSSVQSKSTQGRGSSSKRNLYGVKKLREFILELALIGHLTHQDLNEDSEKDLGVAVAKKNKMVEGGFAKPVRGVKLGEGGILQSKIPSSWKICLFEEVAWPQAGFAFSSKSFNNNKAGLPLIRIRDVGAPFSGTYYDGEYRQEFVVRKGDILVSMDGEFRVRPWKNEEALLNQRVSRLFFSDACSEKFCSMAIQKSVFSLQCKKSYLTVDHLSTKQISSSQIPFPPIAEQHRIVAKVDELMALCDTLEQQQEDSIQAHETLVETLLGALTNPPDAEAFQSAWQRVSAHFDTLLTTEHSVDKLKETILQLAVMGKLVPQDPNDELASVLLEKIAADKEQLIKDGVIKKKNSSLETDDEEPIFKIPDNWELVNLDQITAITGGKRVSKGYKLKLEPTPFIYIRVTDMKNGTIDDSNLHFIGADEREKIKRYIIHKGDIYMTIVGATIGKCGIVPPKFDNMNLTENAARIKVISGVNNKFLYLILRGEYCQNQFAGKTNKVGVEKMALTRLASTKIPLPPQEEQHRIAAKVDELMALCDDLKQSLNEAQTTQMQLTDAVTEQAVN